ANATTEVFDATKNKTCSCVSSDEERKLDTLLVSRRHMHLVHENEIHDYFASQDECSGHTFVLVPFSPSPPPPEGSTPPPAPPIFEWEIRVATGGVAVSGLWFLCCFAGCFGFFGARRMRGTGRSKWWGTRELRIDRPPLGKPDDEVIFSTGSNSFVQSLPAATRPLLSSSNNDNDRNGF
ncbi:hypothetical protein N9S81_00560, partial [bacterium]|nr:hypothetical protein [bacterium]